MKRCCFLLIIASIILIMPSCSSNSSDPTKSSSMISLFGAGEISVAEGEAYDNVLVYINGDIPAESLKVVSEDESIAYAAPGNQLSVKSMYLNIEGISEGTTQVYIEIPDKEYVSEKITVHVGPSEGSSAPAEKNTVSESEVSDTQAVTHEVQNTADSRSDSDNGSIEITNLTSPVKRGRKMQLSIKGKPNTEYSIKVYYSSTVSRAKGLENKSTDSNGLLTWEWRVGSSTASGEHKITISGGGDTKETYFETID